MSADELRVAVTTLTDYDAPDPEQEAVRRRFLELCDGHPDALLRTCRPGHLTASALVVDEQRTATLLTLHAKLGRWFQLGGHCDGEGDLAAVALREAEEESGLEGLRCVEGIADLDIHPIASRSEGDHWHYDARFVVVAPGRRQPVISDESLDLRWVELDEPELELDAGLRRLIARAAGTR